MQINFCYSQMLKFKDKNKLNFESRVGGYGGGGGPSTTNPNMTKALKDLERL